MYLHACMLTVTVTAMLTRTITHACSRSLSLQFRNHTYLHTCMLTIVLTLQCRIGQTACRSKACRPLETQTLCISWMLRPEGRVGDP